MESTHYVDGGKLRRFVKYVTLHYATLAHAKNHNWMYSVLTSPVYWEPKRSYPLRWLDLPCHWKSYSVRHTSAPKGLPGQWRYPTCSVTPRSEECKGLPPRQSTAVCAGLTTWPLANGCRGMKRCCCTLIGCRRCCSPGCPGTSSPSPEKRADTRRMKVSWFLQLSLENINVYARLAYRKRNGGRERQRGVCVGVGWGRWLFFWSLSWFWI